MHDNTHIQTVDFSRMHEQEFRERSLDKMCWTIEGKDKVISEQK